MVLEIKQRTLTEISAQIDEKIGAIEQIQKDFTGRRLDENADKKWKELAASVDDLTAEYKDLSTRDAALLNLSAIREKHAGKSALNIQHDAVGVADRTPGAGEIPAAFRKAFSPGTALIESPQFKALIDGYGIKNAGDVPANVKMEMSPAHAGMSYKDLLTSAGASGGSLYRPQRLDGIQEILRPALRIVDLIPAIPVSTNAIEYVRQNLRVNNAMVVPESTSSVDMAGLKPESALGFTVITDSLETIAHMLPATRQILADAPQLRAFVDAFLRQGLMEQLEALTVARVLAASGILVQAKGTDTVLDALHKGATKVMIVGLTQPQSYVLHPLDWETIRLTKDLNGQYLMGPPSVAGAITLWGYPVISSLYLTAGTGLIADWNTFGAMYEREDIQTYVTDSHADWFARNLIAILMEMRAKLAIYRAASLCRINGLNT